MYPNPGSLIEYSLICALNQKVSQNDSSKFKIASTCRCFAGDGKPDNDVPYGLAVIASRIYISFESDVEIHSST